MRIAILFRNLLLSAMLLTACRDYDDIPGLPAVDILTCFNAEGKAWLTLDLNLPEQDGATRAVTFDDGTSAEHTVRTLTLVLFHGTGTEDQMQVASVYQLAYEAVDDSHPQVTHHSRKAFQISSDNIVKGDRLAILAIANASPDIKNGNTFAQVRSMTTGITTTIDGTQFFVMTSSPLATANDGSGIVSTLMEISAANLYDTENEANDHPAGHIYLERAAAKITVKETVGSPKELPGNPNISFESSDLAYAIDNYNTAANLVRYFNASWLPYRSSNDAPLRFVETTPLPAQPARYRTYWAQDQNYTGSTGLIYKTHAQRENITWRAMNNNSYCAENTFEAAHQQDDCTTSVLVRLQLNNGGDFFTTSTTGGDIVYLPPRNSVSEEGTSASESFSRQHRSPAFNAKTIDEYLRTWLMQAYPSFRNWVNTYAAGETKHVSIAVGAASDWETTGKATIVKVAQSACAANTAGADAFDALDVVSYINTNITIYYYNNGYCYYRVPLRHFTDEETEWQSTPQMTGNATSQAYQANGEFSVDHRYLGRYGLVRNNWYNINIRKIAHIGNPIIPALTQNADDRVEQLLNATLVISSWTSHDEPL